MHVRAQAKTSSPTHNVQEQVWTVPARPKLDEENDSQSSIIFHDIPLEVTTTCQLALHAHRQTYTVHFTRLPLCTLKNRYT